MLAALRGYCRCTKALYDENVLDHRSERLEEKERAEFGENERVFSSSKAITYVLDGVGVSQKSDSPTK